MELNELVDKLRMIGIKTALVEYDVTPYKPTFNVTGVRTNGKDVTRLNKNGFSLEVVRAISDAARKYVKKYQSDHADQMGSDTACLMGYYKLDVETATESNF